MKLSILALLISVSFFSVQSQANNGMVPNWSSAKKIQVGTSNTGTKSLVWFTNAQGILTETYFPTIDKAQIKDSQFVVTDGKTFFAEEKDHTLHEVEVIHPSLVKLKNQHNRFRIEHVYYTAADSNTLIDEVTVYAFEDGLDFYLLTNPALSNTGYHDNGRIEDGVMHFWQDDQELFVRASVGFEKAQIGYVAVDDGHLDLRLDYQLNNLSQEKFNGNIAGTGKINIPAKKGVYKFFVSYSFDRDSVYTYKQFVDNRSLYIYNWDQYLNKLKKPAFSSKEQETLYLRSLYTLHVHEDKLTPGAMIASLSKPWGEELREYPGVFTGGYHLIWPRDLFHVSLALIQAGDLEAPKRALGFLKKIQYKDGVWNFNNQRIVERKGAFPQNTWTDQNEYWGGFQIDQVGYPIQLFWHLYKRADATERQNLMHEYGEMVYLASEFILRNGPWSAQERWEENYGISPSSFSVAAAAMKVASKIFNEPKYADTANEWLTKPYDNIHSWTFTTTGEYGDGNYYVRVAGCDGFLDQWNPNADSWCTIANSGERVPMKKILDQGFLKLALHGLVPASDWRLNSSLEKVNQNIRKKVGEFHGWYRYTKDAYGEEKRGRLWPLLSSEHGRFEIEKFHAGMQSWKLTLPKVNHILSSYEFFANAGLMIPEQVFEGSGEGTGAATPLAWSHAEFIKLLWSKELKYNVENPLK